jgi:hypothetical protein
MHGTPRLSVERPWYPGGSGQMLLQVRETDYGCAFDDLAGGF